MESFLIPVLLNSSFLACSDKNVKETVHKFLSKHKKEEKEERNKARGDNFSIKFGILLRFNKLYLAHVLI